MRRATTFAVLVGVAAGVCAAPVPPENDAARMVRIYGVQGNPKDGTKYEMAGDALRMFSPAREIPPKPATPTPAFPRVHLTPEQIAASRWRPSPIDASRVWREVAGDFEAVVRVSFKIGDATPTNWLRHPQVAGLVALSGGNNHIGMVRSVRPSNMGGADESFRVVFTHPGGVRTGADVLPDSADTAHLKLQRLGNQVIGSFSRDGKKWVSFLADEVDWKEAVKVGVFASHLSDIAFDVTFDEYKLTVPK